MAGRPADGTNRIRMMTESHVDAEGNHGYKFHRVRGCVLPSRGCLCEKNARRTGQCQERRQADHLWPSEARPRIRPCHATPEEWNGTLDVPHGYPKNRSGSLRIASLGLLRGSAERPAVRESISDDYGPQSTPITVPRGSRSFHCVTCCRFNSSGTGSMTASSMRRNTAPDQLTNWTN